MSTPDLVRIYAPEFAAYDDPTIQPFLDLAIRGSNPAFWGSLFADAMAFLAAHMLKQSGVNADGTGVVAGFDSSVGTLTAQKDHKLSRAYANAAAAGGGGGASTPEESELMETSYGRRFLAMRKTRSGGKPGVVQVTSVADAD